MLRNYEYISKRKIEVYYPRTTADDVSKLSTKIGFSAKIASAEFSEEKTKTEGHEWRHPLGADAALVTGPGHMPQFTIAEGHATPDPATMAAASL
jgi:hypothetical protein